jgi:hypothetical protein
MASSFSYEAPPAPLSVPQNNVQEAAGTAITSKRVVYVGGLADRATAAGLRSAFIPFGTLQSVDVVRRILTTKQQALFRSCACTFFIGASQRNETHAPLFWWGSLLAPCSASLL